MCHDKPVYQRNQIGEEAGPVLFKEITYSDWWIGPSHYAACTRSIYMQLRSNGCKSESPDGCTPSVTQWAERGTPDVPIVRIRFLDGLDGAGCQRSTSSPSPVDLRKGDRLHRNSRLPNISHARLVGIHCFVELVVAMK
jgi:hypothetical protein